MNTIKLYLFFILGLFTFVPNLRGLEYYNFLWAIIYIFTLILITFDVIKLKRVPIYFILFGVFLLYILILPMFSGDFDISKRFLEISLAFSFNIFSLYISNGKTVNHNKSILLILIITSFYCLININNFLVNPFISRSIKTGDTSSLSLGVADYNFIYFITFCFIVLLYRARSTSLKKQLAIYSIIILYAVTIYLSNFTIALLIIIFASVLRIFGSNPNKKSILISLFIIFVFSLIFRLTIYNQLLTNDNIIKSTNKDKIVQLTELFALNTIGESIDSRFNHYKSSIISFSNSPIFGQSIFGMDRNYYGQITTDSFGQHSMIFDILAVYGLVGFILVVYIIKYSFDLDLLTIRQKGKIYAMIFFFLLFITFNNLTPSVGFAVFYFSRLTNDNR